MTHYIITNFKSSGFACSKMCKDCNWINHPFLTNSLPSINSLKNFLKTNVSRNINISGGGDPLYDYINSPNNLELLIDRIIAIDPQIHITLYTGITNIDVLNKVSKIVNDLVVNISGHNLSDLTHLSELSNLKVSMIYNELCDINTFKKDVEYVNKIFNKDLNKNDFDDCFDVPF